VFRENSLHVLNSFKFFETCIMAYSMSILVMCLVHLKQSKCILQLLDSVLQMSLKLRWLILFELSPHGFPTCSSKY
jgi:hypothetical protein